MQGDAAQEDRLAVEQDLRAVSFDGAEANGIAHFVGAGRERDLVKLGVTLATTVQAWRVGGTRRGR